MAFYFYKYIAQTAPGYIKSNVFFTHFVLVDYFMTKYRDHIISGFVSKFKKVISSNRMM